MTKDEAIAVLIQAWDTNALSLHHSCTGDQHDTLIQAIEVLKSGRR